MKIGKPFRENYPVTQPFGNRLFLHGVDVYAQYGYKGHNGIDYGVPTGTEIIACDKGTIEFVGNEVGGYGNYVKIRHEWGFSYYAHLRNYIVSVGQQVTRGQAVGFSNNTGNSTAPHLHFGIKGNPIDTNNGYRGYENPAPYFGEEEAPSQGGTDDMPNFFDKNDDRAWTIAIAVSYDKSPEAVAFEEVVNAKNSALTPFAWLKADLKLRVFPLVGEEAVSNYVKEHPNPEPVPSNPVPVPSDPGPQGTPDLPEQPAGSVDPAPPVPDIPVSPRGSDNRTGFQKLLDFLKQLFRR